MNILYVMAFPPFPLEVTGGAIRSHLLLDALEQIGTVRILYLNYRGPDHGLGSAISSSFDDGTVPVLSIAMPGTSGSKYKSYLEKASRGAGMLFGSGLATAGLRVSIDAARAVAELCDRSQVDLIVGRFSRASAAAGLLSKNRVPLIIDADDWEPSRSASRARSTSRSNLLLRAYRQLELRGSLYLGNLVLEKADHVWLASEKDAAALDRHQVTTLPNLPLSSNGEEITALGPSAAGSRIIFSVGDWKRKQNSDGMSWYLRQVWPLICQRVPEAELRIAGVAHPSDAYEWGAVRNVRMLGFVDSLLPEYEKAALIAAPITWGGGTKIKVLEALAYGRVPAGTEHAFEGLPEPRKLQQIAAIEDEPARLAESTIELLANAPMRKSRETAAGKYYLDHHSVAAFNKLVKDTIESVLISRKAGPSQNLQRR